MNNIKNLELKIGSIIKLKSEESPSMVINKELSDEMVECVWFNGNISKKETFNINTLFNYGDKVEYNILLEEKFSRMTNDELDIELKKLENIYE